MKVHFFSGLGFKIGLTVVVIEAAALTILGSFYLRRFSDQVDEALRTSLAKPGQLMSQGVLNMNMASDRNALEPLVGPGLVELMVISADGHIFHATDPALAGESVDKLPEFDRRWIEKARTGVVLEELKNDRDSFLIRVSPVDIGSDRAAFLFVYVKMRTTEAENEKAMLQKFFVGGSIVTVGATSIALLFFFRFLFTRRLARIGQTVDHVAAGNLDARCGPDGWRDEIGRMQHGVDNMAERLQQTIAGLKNAEDERIQLEREVAHAQKLKSLGILAGGIAHDFNNILTAILGHADMALLDLPDDSPLKNDLLAIERATQRAAALARQMLAYSGKGRFLLTPINLNSLFREVTQLLTASISKKITLKLEPAKDLPDFLGDSTQITQVIMNLVTNAAEAIGDAPGTITIRTGLRDCDAIFLSARNHAAGAPSENSARPGRYVFLEVSDTGCGMDTATIERIFDPFFTTKFTGRGLGLAVVHGIIRGHHGLLHVESRKGLGTTFCIYFPAEAIGAKDAPATGPSAATPAAYQGHGLILFADDEEAIRALATSMLEQLGHTVITARDGIEAVELFQTHASEIRCAILDITMPRLDGEAAYNRIHAEAPALPVLLCSGYSEQSIVERFSGKPVAGFIQKPFTLATLAERLRTALCGNGTHSADGSGI